MFIPKWFTPKELFPPEIANRKKIEIDPVTKKTVLKKVPFDLINWKRYDERILKMYDQLREDHGKITGNEGGLTGCGIRLGDGLSQHYSGRAIDGHPKHRPVFEIRKSIILNRKRYPFITFIEVDIFGKNSGKPWLHADCRNNGGKLQLWSPKRGWVKIEDYLMFGDK